MFTAIGLILIIVPTLIWLASVLGIFVIAITRIGNGTPAAHANLIGGPGILAFIGISAGIIVLSYGYGLI